MFDNFRKKLSYGLVKKINRKIEKEAEEDVMQSPLCFVSLMGMVGWTFIVPILLALFIGGWLTKYFDNPIIMISFIFAGVVVGFMNTFKEINKLLKRTEKSKKD